MTPPLSPAGFADFFQAVQRWRAGRWDADAPDWPPFPWQRRLLEEVADAGRWPDLLDLPTGSGKTAAIDVAVFHLALESDRGAGRRAAMRIAFVVDRRLVVDEAYRRARTLQDALADACKAGTAAPEVMQGVARRLRVLAGDDRPPLVARALRGGAPREDDWAETPCQPTVLCSTVDQVGSRLLFRGYGVSDAMKPVHAGLLGSDALILLDEAHLAEPFRQTVRAIAEHRSLRGPDAAPLQVALLTATPGEEAARDDGPAVSGSGEQRRRDWRFGLSEQDRTCEALRRRIEASKPVRLAPAGNNEADRADVLTAEALKLFRGHADDRAFALGVIANRVARARAVFETLRDALGESAEVVLVIGRARAADRERVAHPLAVIRTGAERRLQRPLVVVATQTLEAGVDLDLDALVTDAASLDALRQRFGRVNRAGRDIAATGVIVAGKDDRKAKRPDPIYGEAIARTLEALFPTDREEVDFGVAAMDAALRAKGLEGKAVQSLIAEKPDAPVLMPAYVDLWSQTSPVPACDPDAALFLHGPRSEPAGVQVVWRADLDPSDFRPSDGADLAQASQRPREILALAPPRATEAIELPLWTVRTWLAREREGTELADAPGALREAEPAGGRAAFVWRGPEDERSRLARPRDIRPGDVVVVPSGYGGCDAYGWSPSSEEPVRDVYDRAAEPYAARRFVVRVAPALIRQAVSDAAASLRDDEGEPLSTEALDARAERAVAAAQAILSDPGAGARSLAGALAEALADLAPALHERLGRLASEDVPLDRPVLPYAEEDAAAGVVLVAPRGVRNATLPMTQVGATPSTEDDQAGSQRGRAQALADHSAEVEALARAFAHRTGLEPKVVEDVALAAWLHDAGKADGRFQDYLREDEFLWRDQRVLAKSARGRSARGAAERAGLPPRWRHEALSVRLAMAHARFGSAHDRRLVLWLVGSHHGYGRPFFPHGDDLDRPDAGPREFQPVEGLVEETLAAGLGPQSLGFTIEGEAFGPTPNDGRDLRGLDWATMFRELRRDYGAWGLARLEAVLRLADHRASEAGAA